jgi:phosphoribosylaminoimidazolecarboxamide formyltransferase/IMP cyclohydrolase
MSIRENIYKVVDLIKPSNVLVSVFDKGGLEELIKALIEVNPDIKFYSTGGTGKKIIDILGVSASRNYISVEDFTGAPEMEGGLVKTLHPKLYPFTSVVAKEDTASETARVNIDIGGPAMTMASAKNWHSIAVLTSASQYEGFIRSLKENSGHIPLEQRFNLATEAMRSIGEYRSAIGDYFSKLDFEKDVKPDLNIGEQ